MTNPASTVEILTAEAATPEFVKTFTRLFPQLSNSATPLTLEALATISVRRPVFRRPTLDEVQRPAPELTPSALGVGPTPR